MANTYRATSAVGEHYYGEGISELDLSPTDEQDWLNAGHLELVPRAYEVLSDNYAGGKQGDSVELALLREHEEALILGGHIKRVDKKPAAKAAEKKEK